MLRAFEDVGYNLKLHEVSQPVETKYGYHVLRKYDAKPSTTKAYAVVKDEIVAKIKQEYIQNRLNDYYAQVKKDSGMKIDSKLLDSYIAEKRKQLDSATKSASVSVPVK
jgi:parvulin-like peptidyl-prolyl isomerase